MGAKGFDIKVWLEAFRLRTLPLSLSCILMGSFLAAASGRFRWDICILAVATTVLLQVLSNLANDYGDSIHGADSAEREGPSRAVQKGAISKAQMKKAIVLFALLAFLTGFGLLFLAFRDHLVNLAIFLSIGIASIFAAINYTAGKKPYGYKGLGDLAVFVFFGIVGVGGTYFLQTAELDFLILLPAATCGLFATGVLNINNIRDIESDKLAGKISIPVRLGRDKAVVYHYALLTVGYGLSVLFILFNYTHLYQWLFLVTIPMFIINARAVKNHTTASQIDPFLKQLSISTLLFVIVFGVGLLLAY